MTPEEIAKEEQSIQVDESVVESGVEAVVEE